MAKTDWDNNDYKESGFAALPKGRYVALIDDCKDKQTRDKTGRYFEFTFVVAKGSSKGRKLWARLNVHNRSDIAQRIGREQYYQLCLAAKMPECRDTDRLLNRLVCLIVDIDQDDRGKDVNRVTGFLSPTEADREGAATSTPRSTERSGAEQRIQDRKTQDTPADPSAGSKPAGSVEPMDDDDIPF